MRGLGEERAGSGASLSVRAEEVPQTSDRLVQEGLGGGCCTQGGVNRGMQGCERGNVLRVASKEGTCTYITPHSNSIIYKNLVIK